jgi:putative hydroxymethylpyrimidine transport system substrate-binding protein
VLATLTATLIVGCGGGGKNVGAVKPLPANLQEVKMALQGYAGPEEAAIFMAQERQFFAGVGLDVWTGAPISPDNPVKYVATGADDFAVALAAQVVIEREAGAPVVAVGSLVSRPTTAMIWLKKSKIHSIADLAGKTIAVPGITYQDGFLKSLLARSGLTVDDVKVKRVGYRLIPALLSGRADAIFGGSANLEGIELRSRGVHPVIVSGQSLGFPACDELVVVARSRFVDENPKLIRKLMSAVTHGAGAAVKDPEGAVAAVANAPEANPATSSDARKDEIEATLPLLSTTGYMSPARFRCLERWMYRQGLIHREPPVSALLTNRYSP